MCVFGWVGLKGIYLYYYNILMKSSSHQATPLNANVILSIHSQLMMFPPHISLKSYVYYVQ